MARKANEKVAFGLDFGTTQSYLAYVPPGRPDNVQLANVNPDPQAPKTDQPTDLSMPSKVFLRYDDSGGQIALRVLDKAPDLFGAEFVPLTRFKAHLEESRERQQLRTQYRLPATAPGQPADYVEPEAIVGFLMGRMRQLALKDYEVTGQSDTVEMNDVTVTIPAESEITQRMATQFAARLAGFEGEIYLLEEPVAAFLYHYQRYFEQRFKNRQGVHVLVFDFGGGTCDLSLIRFNGRKMPTVLGRRSAQVGGEYIDEMIARRWLSRRARTKGIIFEELTSTNRHYLLGWARLAKEQLSAVNWFPAKVGTLPEIPGNGSNQKIDIGRRSLDRPTLVRLLTHDLFVTNIAGEDSREWTVLGLVNELVDSLLRKTRVDHDRIEAIILAGGSSRLVAVREFLQQKFPTLGDRLIMREPEASIAKGAALYQYYRHAGSKEMRKLTEPTLAHDIYLDHSYEPGPLGPVSYRHSVILGKQNQQLPIERGGKYPLLIPNVKPSGGVVNILLWHVGRKGKTTLLPDAIPVRSKGDHVLQVHYRITEFGTIENFACFTGSKWVPPIIGILFHKDRAYRKTLVREGQEYGALLEDYDLHPSTGTSIRIRSLRDKYQIDVDR